MAKRAPKAPAEVGDPVEVAYVGKGIVVRKRKGPFGIPVYTIKVNGKAVQCIGEDSFKVVK